MSDIVKFIEGLTSVVGALTILVMAVLGLVKSLNFLIKRSRFLANSLGDFLKKDIGFRRRRKDGTAPLVG